MEPPALDVGDPCPVCASALLALTPSVLCCSSEECARVFLSTAGHAALAARPDAPHDAEPGMGVCHCGSCALSEPHWDRSPQPQAEPAPSAPPEFFVRTPLQVVSSNDDPEPASAPHRDLHALPSPPEGA